MKRKHTDNYKLKDDWLLLSRVSNPYNKLFSRGHLQGVQQLSQSSSSPVRDHFQDLSCSTHSINAIVSKGASSTDVSSAATAHLCIQVSRCLINKSMTPEIREETVAPKYICTYFRCPFTDQEQQLGREESHQPET